LQQKAERQHLLLKILSDCRILCGPTAILGGPFTTCMCFKSVDEYSNNYFFKICFLKNTLKLFENINFFILNKKIRKA
jgi:hypothetical protein